MQRFFPAAENDEPNSDQSNIGWSSLSPDFRVGSSVVEWHCSGLVLGAFYQYDISIANGTGWRCRIKSVKLLEIPMSFHAGSSDNG